MKRVAVIGPSGTGKSTLALELSRRLNILVIHLDQYHWQPGWVGTEQSVWRVRPRKYAS